MVSNLPPHDLLLLLLLLFSSSITTITTTTTTTTTTGVKATAYVKNLLQTKKQLKRALKEYLHSNSFL